MLGDTAVAVHPDDPRYRHLIGRSVSLPLTGREIPIIADGLLVDPEFGTGCVKVTPAHDPNDYQTGLRHALPMINLLNPDGTFNENAGAYAGLDRRVVRKRVVADLEAQGLLEKVEAYATRLNYSDRSKTPIEPYLSDQWFVPNGRPGPKRNGRRDLRAGQDPSRALFQELPRLVGREARLVHQPPTLVGAPDSDLALRRTRGRRPGTRFAGRSDVTWRKAEAGGWLICAETDLPADALGPQFELRQDPDVLDTWFSSALWPHSTLGWPEETPELAKYYPTNVLSTARDIITLWVARMVIFGLFNRNDVPFKDVFIHPVIQDGKGQRMSKSAGNGIDPVDIIDLYGADALRYTLAYSATETQDLRMPVGKAKLPDGREVNTSERFEQGRTFPNKFWNAARLVLLNLEGYEPGRIDVRSLPVEDRWILSRLREIQDATTRDLETFHFAEATKACATSPGMSSATGISSSPRAGFATRNRAPSRNGSWPPFWTSSRRLLHPIMPFVTEQVWQRWARWLRNAVYPNRCLPRRACASLLGQTIPTRGTMRRRWRSWSRTGKVRSRSSATCGPRTTSPRMRRFTRLSWRRMKEWLPGSAWAESFLKSITPCESVTIVTESEEPPGSVVAVGSDVRIILPLDNLIDLEAEAARQRKLLADIDRQLAAIRNKLGNESFLSRAPAAVVEQQRAKEAELVAQRELVVALLAKLEDAKP